MAAEGNPTPFWEQRASPRDLHGRIIRALATTEDPKQRVDLLILLDVVNELNDTPAKVEEHIREDLQRFAIARTAMIFGIILILVVLTAAGAITYKVFVSEHQIIVNTRRLDDIERWLTLAEARLKFLETR